MLGKEGAKLVERDKVYAIVKIYVAGTRNSDKLLRFCCTLVVWLCHKSGKLLKSKRNLRRFRVRLETKKLFNFNHLTINPTMFMTQS
jgi:hypothetical protein